MSRHTSPRLYRPCHAIAHPCSGPARVHETEQGGAQLAEREMGGKHHANTELVEQHAVPPRFSRRVERRLHRGAVYAGCARNCSQDHGAEPDSQGAHQRDPRSAHAARDQKLRGSIPRSLKVTITGSANMHCFAAAHAPCIFQSFSRNANALPLTPSSLHPGGVLQTGGNCCPECWG